MTTKSLVEEANQFLTPSTLPPPTPTAEDKKQKSTRAQKYGRQVVPPSVGLSAMMLPPITRRRSAIYELNRDGVAEQREVSRVMNGMILPAQPEIAPQELYPVYQIYDRGESDLAKARKTLVFAANHNQIQDYFGASQNNDKDAVLRLPVPQFINGQTIVDCEAEYLKFLWWELHPLNGSNKFRDKGSRPKFKRVDTEFKSPHIQMLRMDLANDAENYVKGLDLKGLINLGVAFGLPPTYPAQDMRLDLRIRARKNPEDVLYKSPDKSASNMMLVLNAIDRGIVDFDPNTKEYFFQDESEPFYQVPLDLNPIESIGKYLNTAEGIDYGRKIGELLNFWID